MQAPILVQCKKTVTRQTILESSLYYYCFHLPGIIMFCPDIEGPNYCTCEMKNVPFISFTFV